MAYQIHIKRTYGTLIAASLLIGVSLLIAAKVPSDRYLVKEEKFVSKGKVTALVRYTYDEKGRVILTQDDTFAMKMIYKGDTVYQQGRYRGSAYNSLTFILGPNGVATSDNSGKLFMYNGDGYMTAAVYPNGSFQSMTVENGDVVSITTTVNGSRSGTTCVFYPEVDKKDLGQGIFGKRDKHLLKTLITTQGVHSDTLRYTHKLDGLGRVVSETYIGPGVLDTTTIYSTYYDSK